MKIFTSNQLIKYVGEKSVKIALFGLIPVLSATQISAQRTFTFTSCGATGMTGPTQTMINSTYTSTNSLNGLVTSSNGVQKFIVPSSGTYKMEVYAASGGTNSTFSGYGAMVSGIVSLTGGSTLNIVVGQMGSMYATTYSDGGGGGSFVAENSTLLFAAGGGGGAAQVVSASQNASISQTNLNPLPSQFGSQGAGASTPGVHFTYGVYTSVAQSFFGGATGQAGGQAGGWPGTNYGEGGFGGGGSACSCSTGGGGGGGGYVGGGGGASGYQSGTGGSSYLLPAATTTAAALLTTFGEGKIIITELCNVNISAAKNPICLGESVTLSTNAITTTSWSTPGAGTASSVVVSPVLNTSYSVTGTGTNNCVSTAVVNVTVVQLPVLSALVTPGILCAGSAATVYAMGGVSYTWAAGPSGTTTNVSPIATTIYNFTGSNRFGCVNTGSFTVNVNTNSLTVSANTTICEGKSIYLNASGASSYTWSTGPVLSGILVAPTTNTTYVVSGMDANSCLLSNTISVGVNASPNITASSSKDVICRFESLTLTAGGGNTYQWSNGSTGSSLNLTLNADLIYTYTVTGTDNNGCSKDAMVTVTVSACTGVDELNTQGHLLSIYPNPGTGLFTLESSVSGVKVIEIVDYTGRIVSTKTTSADKVNFDISNLANGIYYAKVKGEKISEVVKIVKSTN